MKVCDFDVGRSHQFAGEEAPFPSAGPQHDWSGNREMVVGMGRKRRNINGVSFGSG